MTAKIQFFHTSIQWADGFFRHYELFWQILWLCFVPWKSSFNLLYNKSWWLQRIQKQSLSLCQMPLAVQVHRQSFPYLKPSNSTSGLTIWSSPRTTVILRNFESYTTSARKPSNAFGQCPKTQCGTHIFAAWLALLTGSGLSSLLWILKNILCTGGKACFATVFFGFPRKFFVFAAWFLST